MDGLDWLFGMIMGMYWLIIIIAVVMYVIGSLARAKVLKNLGYDKPWMGWIPIGDTYALVTSLRYGGTADLPFNINVPIWVVQFYGVISYLISIIPVVGGIVGVLMRLVCGYWLYAHLFGIIDGKQPSEETGLAIVSAFIGIVAIVKFFGSSPVDVDAYYGRTSDFGYTNEQEVYSEDSSDDEDFNILD